MKRNRINIFSNMQVKYWTMAILTIVLVMSSLVADAQFRYGYPYPPYRHWNQDRDRVGRNGEIQKERRVRNNNRPTKLHLNLNYAISQPFGGLKDYADKTSFNGWRASLLYQINPNWTVGLGSGFHDYYKRLPRKVYADKNSAISAVQTHTMQLIPIQPTVLYFPGDGESKIKPYVGLGIGITDVVYKNYWGEFLEKGNNIAFSASPMAGIRIPFSATSPLQFNADLRYNFISYNKYNINTIHTLGASVGLSINIR